MKRTALMTAILAAMLIGCGSDENPVGVTTVRYWDIVWSSPHTVLTDIEMLGEKSGWACGYRFNETWSMQAGYRHLSIDRTFDRADVTLEVSGPIIGVQASF